MLMIECCNVNKHLQVKLKRPVSESSLHRVINISEKRVEEHIFMTDQQNCDGLGKFQATVASVC